MRDVRIGRPRRLKAFVLVTVAVAATLAMLGWFTVPRGARGHDCAVRNSGKLVCFRS
jgi:hypothetical protein